MSDQLSPLVFVVLAWYSDGSSQGPETVIAVFRTRTAAERFVDLATTLHPSKQLGIAPMGFEQ